MLFYFDEFFAIGNNLTYTELGTALVSMEVDTSSATTWRVVNIIKEECLKAGHPVEEALICCTLKMIYDNPKNGFDSDMPMDRHAVRRLIGKSFLYVLKQDFNF